MVFEVDWGVGERKKLFFENEYTIMYPLRKSSHFLLLSTHLLVILSIIIFIFPMSIESQIQQEQEKNRKIESELKQEIEKTLKFSKEKGEILTQIGKKKELTFLKSLVERGLLGLQTAEIIASSTTLETNEIEAIFEKIDAIEQVPDVEKILPKALRLTKEAYIEALENENMRKEALQKIHNALTHIYEYGNPNNLGVTLGVFFSGFFMLNKNLVLIQEHTIDIKNSLI